MSNARSSNVRKRKRPVTSCGECYRRKQKCDREKPCAICIHRGVPDRCSYENYESTYVRSTTRPVKSKHATVSATPVIHPRLTIISSETNVVIAPPPKRVALPPSPETSNSTVSECNASTTPPDLGEQIGYASANGSNFSILQKSLHSNELDGRSNDQPPSRSLPDIVLYQILQIERHLPSYAIQHRLLEIYFDQCWWWFTSLDPVVFRQRLSSGHVARRNGGDLHDKDQQYFSALLFQVMAVALQYVQKTDTDIWESLDLTDAASADKLSTKYSTSGVQVMDLLGRHESCVTAIQHDILRGIWLKNANRGTESWHSLSNAIRQAQELRLHQKQDIPSFPKVAESNTWRWQDELRKRVWVCLFNWDTHVALTLGRPRIINAGDCARISLIACDVPEDLSLSAPAQTMSQQPKPHLITPIIFQNAIAYLIHEMLDRGADRPTLNDYTILDQLHADIRAVCDSVSPYFRYEKPDTSWDELLPEVPSMRLHISSIANTYLVALHRAHVLRRPESCEAAVDAAVKILTAQEELFGITPRHKWRMYTYAFYTIDASIFLNALLLEQPMHLGRTWPEKIKAALEKAMDRLERLQEASQIAKTGVQVLQKCQEKLQQQQTAKQSLATENRTSTAAHSEAASIVEMTKQHDFNTNSSLKSWIEQMDQVMLPIMEYDPSGPFDNTLWDMLLEG